MLDDDDGGQWGALADDVAGELETDNDSLISQSLFLRDVEAAGLWSRSDVHDAASAITVFVPSSYVHWNELDIVELWNRHTAQGLVRIGGEGTMQIASRSKLVFALYPIENSSTPRVSTSSRHAIGAVAVGDTFNVEYNGCIFHAIESCLPELRPVPGSVALFRTIYVSNESLDIQFQSTGLDPQVEANNFTLIVSTTDSRRTPFANNQKMPWHGNGTQCKILIPSVAKRQTGMIWLSLYDNKLRHPVVTMAFPWYIVIEPNNFNQTNPRVLDVIPKRGRAHEEFWIRGIGFDERSVRVMFDNQVAQVYFCDSKLIGCFVPPSLKSGDVHVWVANANIYTRYDGKFEYEDDASTSNEAMLPFEAASC